MPGDDPVALPRACKNPAEQAGARRAQLRDAVAVCAFLAWLDAEIEAGQPHDEASLADELYRLRKRDPLFRGSSFDTISAAGPNAALCHYNYLDGSPAKLVMDSVYLVDSGAQYPDGTTDITRTVAIGDPGDEVRRLYTLVLKGHIALALCRFPPGTSGSQLDAIARQYLWREGFDYDHGTGHGVGAYLSVHEGPQRISRVQNSVALRPGMIVSNEPGYYREGAFGMRCENLVLVGPCEREGVERPMLEFETLTLVPFDRRLLDPSLLDPEQRGWLDRYHDRVWRQVGPLLGDSERAWLRRATRPLD
jgi:Xaa-Pro aminopeptidase